MAVFNGFTFDGMNSLEYGIFITGEAVYNAPERSIELVTIPGKNGALALDEGRFENIQVTYPAGAFGTTQAEFRERIDTFRNILASRYNYVSLVDTYHPDEYRLALYRSGLEVEAVNNSTAGEFEIEFECKPQRFLTTGIEVTSFTASGSITNPTLFDAKPLIRVYGTGTVGIGSYSFKINTANVYTDIDCDIQDAYKGTVNCNNYVEFTNNTFPVLKPGANGVSLGTGITRVEITPRWWRI